MLGGPPRWIYNYKVNWGFAAEVRHDLKAPGALINMRGTRLFCRLRPSSLHFGPKRAIRRVAISRRPGPRMAEDEDEREKAKSHILNAQTLVLKIFNLTSVLCEELKMKAGESFWMDLYRKKSELRCRDITWLQDRVHRINLSYRGSTGQKSLIDSGRVQKGHGPI